MSSKEEKPNKKRKVYLYTRFLIFVDICAIICFVLVYGVNYFQNLIVTNALTSKSHRYFAYIFYNEDMVKEIANRNITVESSDKTDTSAIKFTEITEQDTYESIYEEQILKKDKDNDLYKLIKVDEKDYTAYITVIYDPSRISLVEATNLSNGGQNVQTMAKNNKAKVAINAGPAYVRGHSLDPRGVYIENGKVKHNSGRSEKLIGFNKDNVLVLSRMTAEEAIEQNIRDAVVFGPYLIINGKASKFKGDGGYGDRPRTAIGQRQDGIVLLVVVDGKHGLTGITMKGLTDLFIRYKAYNAANLDGGGSSTLVIEEKLINRPVSWSYVGQRHLANAWIVK